MLFVSVDLLLCLLYFRKHAIERRMSNLGYAFVNFTKPSAAFKFYKQFQGFEWSVTQNRKTCEINAAHFQVSFLIHFFHISWKYFWTTFYFLFLEFVFITKVYRTNVVICKTNDIKTVAASIAIATVVHTMWMLYNLFLLRGAWKIRFMTVH